MTAAQRIEYRITRQLLQRREEGGLIDLAHDVTCRPNNPYAGIQIWADRLIAILALTAGLVVVGSYLEELLWVALAAATAFTLRE